MYHRYVVPALVTILASSGPAVADSGGQTQLCADSYEKFLVRDWYRKYQPGAPLPIPSRELELVETKIASGLPPSQSIGVAASRERFEAIWQSIDTWGEDNRINIVITVDGYHAFNFPSKVPVTQATDHPVLYDAYADRGNGVHGHLNPDLMSMVFASKVPARDGTSLRAVSFYDQDGDLIAGLYASEPGKPTNETVLAGFERTWNLIAGMPRACAG